MMNPERDRLIDMLLREELGSRNPPDLSARILAHIDARRRRIFAVATWTAVAAVVAIGVLGWLASRSVYPEPAATGAYQVADGGPVGRGTSLSTALGKAVVHQGGYCQTTLQPHSRIRIQGSERKEAILLEQGEVECTVTGGAGSFTVHTPIGTVSVVGTKFQVRVVDERGDDAMLNKKMVVRVMVGAVLVGGAWGVVQMSGGEEQAFAQQKEKNPLEGKKGKVVGTVVKKADNYIEVKGAGEEEGRKYFPEWRGGNPAQGGGLDKEILKTFRDLKLGSRVEIEWVFHERLRALKVTVLGATKNKE